MAEKHSANENINLDDIKDAIGELKDSVNDQVKVLGKRLKRTVNTGVNEGQERIEDFKDVISDKPLHSVAIAAVAGLVLGFILGKK